MKRKWLCVLLAIFMLPSVMIFSACTDDTVYNMDNVVNDYISAGNNYEYIDIVRGTDGIVNITIDYSSSTALISAISSGEGVYARLDNFYGFILGQTLDFTNNYISICARNNEINDDNLKNSIKADLDSLNSALRTLDSTIGDLIEYTNYYTNNAVSISDAISIINSTQNCLNRLDRTFRAFDSVLEYGANLSVDLADAYYYHILRDGNPNFNSMDITTFNATEAVSVFKNRIEYLCSNLSRNFVEKQVLGASLPWTSTDSEDVTIINAVLSEFESFKSTIDNLNRDISQYEGQAVNNDAELKARYLYLSQQMCNVQSAIDNDEEVFKKAFVSIRYALIKDNHSVGDLEATYINIIDNNALILDYYCDIVNEMIDILIGE